MGAPILHVTPLTGGQDLPVLVVLPSLGTAAAPLWREAARFLTGRFRILAVDLPGHGASPATGSPLTMQSLAEGLRHAVAPFTGGRKFICAGVSIGGAITLQLAQDAPELLSRAVVLNSAAQIGTETAWLERAALIRRDGPAALRAGSEARWFTPDFAQTSRARADELLATLEAADAESYAALCEALALFDLRAALPAIALPLLVIGGAADLATPPEQQLAIANGVPSGRVEILDGVAHLAPAEQPEAVARLISAFAG